MRRTIAGTATLRSPSQHSGHRRSVPAHKVCRQFINFVLNLIGLQQSACQLDWPGLTAQQMAAYCARRAQRDTLCLRTLPKNLLPHVW